jgi:phosphocarrier protein HPr
VVVEKDVQVVNRLGVHARPAAAIVQTVLNFQSDVHFIHNGARINAKSIMGLLTLAATQGTVLKVVCEGPDAEEAMAAVKKLFANGFGE